MSTLNRDTAKGAFHTELFQLRLGADIVNSFHSSFSGAPPPFLILITALTFKYIQPALSLMPKVIRNLIHEHNCYFESDWPEGVDLYSLAAAVTIVD